MNLLICERCGERADHPQVETEAVIRCAHCGHRWPFLRLPLYCLTGPSGTGKSTVQRLLAAEARLADRFVVLEQDVLWVAGLRDDGGEHRPFRSTWLRVAAMINQSRRPVVLCGTVVPPEFEPLPERALFERIEYLCLTCDPGVLAARLRARPKWREWDEPRIAETLDFAAWIGANAATMDPPMTLLDTTGAPVEQTARAVAAWLDERSTTLRAATPPPP
ncbi:AAA family ATPase [Jiangella ureilytica]|uniref:AAA family ATPase n=1 Tax=Jiangella ureilytica TaxID=2530374 RepID=UPI00193E2A6B|nr:AAA family ATPase [Jiangella ureilytica]